MSKPTKPSSNPAYGFEWRFINGKWLQVKRKDFNTFVDKRFDKEGGFSASIRAQKPLSFEDKPKRGFGNTSKFRNDLCPIAKEMARWVSRHKWTHWCTFTFSRETSANSARRQIERFFNRFNDSGLKTLYFVIERGDRYERIHLHALGNFSTNTIADVCWEFWKSKIGRCQIRPFEKEGGAVEYITNYIEKETIDWDLLGNPQPIV